MIDFNEETDILERLGILDSKLECPKKQFLMAKGKDNSASRGANLTSTRSVIDVEDGDEWGAFSLDELSSSSDDSEFLFDRRDLNANGKIHRRVRNHRQGHVRPQCLSKIVTPNLWKLFALLSVSSFAGFSMILSHGMLSFSSTNERISLFYLFRVCGFHALAIWVGSILASSVLLKTNPFCIFLTLMLIFTFICAQIRMAETLTDSKTINQSVVLILCVSQAFVEGAIQRGILLLSPLWTARFHRVLFLCFAAFAFSAGAAFHLQRIHPQNNLSMQKTISADWSFPSFYGNAIGLVSTIFLNRIIVPYDDGTILTVVYNNRKSFNLAKIERRHRRADFEKNKNIPSFLELDLNNTYEQHKTEFYLIDRNDTPNTTYINKLEKNNESETERQQQQPLFKSKTEENAFRRKEVEQKRKKEEEEQNLKEEEEKKGKEEEPKRKEKEEAEKKDKEEKERNEAQKRKEKEEAEKKDKEEKERNEAQKRKEKERQKQSTRKISTSVTSTSSPPKTPSKSTSSNSQFEESMSKESSRGVLFSTTILIGLFMFILPLLFGFCCCCAIDHPICSTQYRNLEALLSPSTTHSDSLSCNMLSMVICALHSALIATLQLSLAITFFSLPFESVSFSSSSFFWVSLAFSRLIFVLRPSFACKSSSIHCLYFVSLLSCSSLHFMPLSNPFSLLFGIAFLGFSAANIPLLLYVWHCSSSHSPSFLSASGRFIAAMAFGKFVGPMVFIWWNSNGINSEGNISRSTFAIPAVFYFGFCILILSYLLFLLMLVKLRKNHRQQQISQLSVALNGDAQKNRRKAKSPKSRTKGPYKALVSSAIGENNINFAQSLDDSEEAKESEEDVDLEMDSIGGEEESDREQRTDKKEEGVYGLV